MKDPQSVSGRYQLESITSSGRFSEVWRGVDAENGMPVAVKIARAGKDPGPNAKLRAEAAILEALDHPGIVGLIDSGTDRGRTFLALEHLDGPSLRDVIRNTGPMTDDEVSTLGSALADALASAHNAGVVHGDIKPEHIIISEGLPRLLGFGSARQVSGSDVSGSDMSDSDMKESVRGTGGTKAYLAPELMAGAAATPRSDIYALGVTLYEARAGRLPFSNGVATAKSRRPVPLRGAAPDVDPRLESAIMQALAGDPAWRPASADDFEARLSDTRHDAIRLREFAARMVAPASEFAGPPAIEPVTLTRGPDADRKEQFRIATPPSDGARPREDRRRAMPWLLGSAAAALGLLFAGAAAAIITSSGGNETQQQASQDGEASLVTVDEVESAIETPEVVATPSATSTMTVTPPPPTVTPVPTQQATATTPPATATSTVPAVTQNIQPAQVQLDPGAGASTVVRWYGLLEDGRFDDAYALWSDSMKARFPRAGNLDSRWANTPNVSMNDARVVAATAERVTVAVDFIETSANGSSRRFVGTWQLVASPNGWLLDQPNF